MTVCQFVTTSHPCTAPPLFLPIDNSFTQPAGSSRKLWQDHYILLVSIKGARLQANEDNVLLLACTHHRTGCECEGKSLTKYNLSFDSKHKGLGFLLQWLVLWDSPSSPFSFSTLHLPAYPSLSPDHKFTGDLCSMQHSVTVTSKQGKSTVQSADVILAMDLPPTNVSHVTPSSRIPCLPTRNTFRGFQLSQMRHPAIVNTQWL